MDLSLTTPGLLFPAISLLLLAYTNRFVALANIIRRLHADYKSQPDPLHLDQIRNLRRRVTMIQHMQEYGVVAFLCCVLSMAGLFFGLQRVGEGFFGLSLILFTISLGISVREIHMSVDALDIRLSDLERGSEGMAADEKKGGG